MRRTLFNLHAQGSACPTPSSSQQDRACLGWAQQLPRTPFAANPPLHHKAAENEASLMNTTYASHSHSQKQHQVMAATSSKHALAPTHRRGRARTDKILSAVVARGHLASQPPATPCNMCVFIACM